VEEGPPYRRTALSVEARAMLELQRVGLAETLAFLSERVRALRPEQFAECSARLGQIASDLADVIHRADPAGT
jgi:hypothetical protein